MEIRAIQTVLKKPIFAVNVRFTFKRFLSDRHKISKKSKNAPEVFYLPTCVPNFRPMGIFKKPVRRLK